MRDLCPNCGLAILPQEERCRRCLHSLMRQDLPKPSKDPFRRALLDHPVSDLLTGRDLLVCRPSDPVSRVVQIFRKTKKGCVLVYEKKKLVGLLSNRDLVMKAAGAQQSLSGLTVGDVMSPQPESVAAEAPLSFAVNKMSVQGLRHLPVIRPDGTPMSILTILDVLQFLSSHRRPRPA